MSQVVFAYILNYQNTLYHLGLSFDPEYSCEVNESRQRISIKKRPSDVKGLYGENISSLTAIVGNNGAGKTMALRFLLNAVINGSAHAGVHGIVITTDGKDLMLYSSEEFKDYSVTEEDVHVVIKRGWPDIPTFIYDGYFHPLLSDDDIMTMEWKGSVNASDGYHLTHDLQRYGNELTSNGNFLFKDYARAYHIQNDHRICLFLNRYQGHFRDSLNLPKYIRITANTAGRWAIENRPDFKDEKVYTGTLSYLDEWKASDRRLAEIIYFSLCNYLADGLWTKTYWEHCVNSWRHFSTEHFRNNIIETFTIFTQVWTGKDSQMGRPRLNSILEVIKSIKQYCRIDEENPYSWFYFYLQDDSDKLQAFLSSMRSKRALLLSRFFDLQYVHDLGKGNSTLSSGEQLMLNMYSRIYNAVVVEKAQISNSVKPDLFIFDEAEIGFHPEWQRCFISNLTTFLSDIASSKRQKFQIIITSHSPIILSDIPSACTIVLKRDKDDLTRCISKTDWQTFGTNIFDLYRESFFLENGLIGKFASAYIEDLDKDIDAYLQSIIKKDSLKERESLLKRINLIGDERIRGYFQYRLDDDDRKRLIAFYQKRLRELTDE